MEKNLSYKVNINGINTLVEATQEGDGRYMVRMLAPGEMKTLLRIGYLTGGNGKWIGEPYGLNQAPICCTTARETCVRMADLKFTEAMSKVIITIETFTGQEYPITQKIINEARARYPFINIEKTLESIKAWFIANPQLRRRPEGIERFIDDWLYKVQRNQIK